MIKLHTFKVTNCSFSHLPIDNTIGMFSCQVEKRKILPSPPPTHPPKVYTMENEKLHAIGMLEAGHSQNSIARHFDKFKSVISPLVL